MGALAVDNHIGELVLAVVLLQVLHHHLLRVEIPGFVFGNGADAGR
jgi:hypothetical protein